MPTHPYLFIIVLELMAIEIREDIKIKGVNIYTPQKDIKLQPHEKTTRQ